MSSLQYPETTFYRSKSFKTLLLLVVSLIVAYSIAKGGVKGAFLVIAIPSAVFFAGWVFSDPKRGLIATFIANYLALGIARYISAPMGLSIDALLIVTYISLFFFKFYDKIDWNSANKPTTYIALIWFGYVFLELFNPQAPNRIAWFYAMRSTALYLTIVVPITLILFSQQKDLQRFFLIWGIFTLLAALNGLKQLVIGPDAWEQAWLDAGAATTHVLNGQLRVFSFLSDAGQYGAAMAHSGVVFLILSFQEKNKGKRLFYLLVALAGLYGMAISGTRGAVFVPFAGLGLYLFLQRNFRLFTIGLLLGLSWFVFLKYTYIGQSNYQIRRMRSAFDTQDASYQVRLANQQKLKAYLASRPFGGGIGTSGDWGLRFSPNTFLAQTPTDSWYVQIWAETGKVGLFLYLTLLGIILFRACLMIMTKIKSIYIRNQLSALVGGFAGILVASYGNGVIGQMPTGVIIYMSLAFLEIGPDFQEEYFKLHPEERTQPEKQRLPDDWS